MAKLSNRARRRRKNPEEEIPFGEWVPANAVMFHDDGTVEVFTEPEEPPDVSSIFGRSGPESGYSYYPSTLKRNPGGRRRRNILDTPEDYGADIEELINSAEERLSQREFHELLELVKAMAQMRLS